MTANSGDNLRIPGLTAAADLSAKQYYVAALNSTGQVKVGAKTAANVGILQNDPAAGEPASVVASGMTKAYAGEDIPRGSWVTSNSTGQCVVSTTANASMIGRAVTVGAAGKLFEVFVALTNY